MNEFPHPTGPSVHGQVDARPGGVVKYDNRYAEPGASGRGNLARAAGLPLRVIAHEDVLVFRPPHPSEKPR